MGARSGIGLSAPMGRTARIAGGAIVALAMIVAGVWLYQRWQTRRAGIVSEHIEHSGDLWSAHFSARVPAPEHDVFAAIEHVEDSHSESIKRVTVVSQEGNKKVVEMEMAAPAGRTIVMRLSFEYFPAERRITYHTIDSPAMQIEAAYKLEDEGSSTLVDFNQKTRGLSQIGAPDAIVKRVIRSIFIAQLDDIRKTLHIASTEGSDEESDEP